MFVRDLNLNPILKLENVKTYMLNKDQTSVKKIESNKIKNITLLNSKIFVNACMEMLEQNEYSLLENN